MNYQQAENAIRAGKKVARKAWPEGRTAYYDVENDGIPDVLDQASPDFLTNAIKAYQRFVSLIRIADGDQVQAGAYINHGDSVADDWYILQ